MAMAEGHAGPLPARCDVLIVGGGPAGLSVAERLAGHADTLVVHQDREIGRPVRTSGGSWVRDLRVLGVPERLYQRIDTLEIRSDNAQARRTMARQKMAVLDVTGLYQWIAARAEAAGARIACGVKFTAIAPDGDGYQATLRLRDGSTARVRARYVIDASGTACAVLAAAGLGARPRRTGVGAEAEFDLIDGPAHDAVLFVGDRVPAGYGWIFPAPGGRVRIGAGVIHPDVDYSPKALLDRILTPAFLDRHRLTLGARQHVNAGIIPSVPYDRRLVWGGIIRVGDSANVATPTVGEGIRLAMLYGRLLGDCLAEGHAGRRKAALKRYERTCRQDLARNYWVGFMANRRIATYGARDWDKSIARVARLDEDGLAALIRSEFEGAALARVLARQITHKFWRPRVRVG